VNPRARSWLLDGASLALGLGLVTAFAPFGFWPLGLGVPILFLLVLDATEGVRRAFVRGGLFGLGLFVWGVSWIYVGLHTVGGIPALGACVLLGLLDLYCALYYALLAALTVRFSRPRSALRALLVYPALWVLAEFLRGRLLTGFPWFELGTSQIHGVFAGYVPLLGAVGTGGVVLVAGGLWLESFRAERGRRILLLALFLVVLAAGVLLARVSWTRRAGPPVTVAVVQGNVPQTMKWKPGMARHELALYRRLSAPLWGVARLVIWPESAITTWYQDVRRPLRRLARRVRRRGDRLVTGILLDRGGKLYNGAVELGGRRPRFYEKHHLVPFAEYFPLPRWARRWLKAWRLPHSGFNAGPRRPRLFRVAGDPFVVGICYEDAFGRDVRRALPRATFLVNISDDAWFGHTIGPFQHYELAETRALETGRWLVRADNYAVSGIVGRDGWSLVRLAPFVRADLTARVVPYRGETPYDRTGETPAVAGALLALVLAAALARRRRPSAPR
jgi:apolipoprotein N-acyltransferase